MYMFTQKDARSFFVSIIPCAILWRQMSMKWYENVDVQTFRKRMFCWETLYTSICTIIQSIYLSIHLCINATTLSIQLSLESVQFKPLLSNKLIHFQIYNNIKHILCIFYEMFLSIFVSMYMYLYIIYVFASICELY